MADQPNGYDDSNEPPSKKRKVAEQDARIQSPRPVSPPWKRSFAEGPASFVENGRRRSGRTNLLPLELQPQASKRQTRAAFDRVVGDRQKLMKPSYNLNQKKTVHDVAHQKNKDISDKHTPSRPSKGPASETPAPMKKEHTLRTRSSPNAAKLAQLEEKLAKLKEEKAKARKGRHASIKSENGYTNGVKEEPGGSEEESEDSPSPSRRGPSPPLAFNKVTFRVRLPKPTIATPANQPPSKKYDTFEDFLQHDDTEPQLGYTHETQSPGQVQKEAIIRRKVRDAQQPGHLLDKKNLGSTMDRQNEPKRQFAHRDHMLAHVVHFRKLLREEYRTHRRRAEIIAHEAKRYVEDKAKRNKVKTKEEIEQEEYLRAQAIYKAVVKDVGKLWAAVLAEVDSMRQKEYEEQQQAKMKGHLARVLDRTDQMLNRDAELDESIMDSDEGTVEDLDDDSSDNSEQMSQSGSEPSSGTDLEDNDAEMTLDELREKYASMPEGEKSNVDISSRAESVRGDQSEGEDSDPETEMDSELDTEDSRDEKDEEEGESEDGTADGGLLSLFSRKELSDMMPETATATEASDEEHFKHSLGLPFSKPEALQTTRNFSRAAEQFEAEEAVVAAQAEVESLGNQDDESDEDIEMDSEFDSDSSGSANDDDEGSGASDAVEGLLSLFSHDEVAGMPTTDDDQEGHQFGDAVVEAPETGSTQVEGTTLPEAQSMEPAATSAQESTEPDHMQVDKPLSLAAQAAEVIQNEEVLADICASSEVVSQEPSTQASPHTTATKASEAESISSVEPHGEEKTIDVQNPHIQTPVPKLLRGTLRIYQHEGLDWLANLYANGRSGILADEMGLGKTIQSISLLAHLAEVHEVWGPHLIVVPTSVMLNWEMEFKKFLPGFKILTYYGNLEERKQKRRGWMADDSFNVCITSYQLVLQDANSFKRRRWHYMILDEAHNIKNFRSERWQTMMTFNTRARLLLTGTPLQNNLTELWSLLFFLHYGQETENEDDAFAGLKEWSEWFKRPVESILEHNKQVLDAEDKEQVAKLHKVIRPFLLRRLKADVEKQMPLKYEHVELCRLSKRQRQLYDGFMSRAQTKETLASGNYLSIINALMQLRKVCNHPDLFETRPINTSFAMSKSVAADFEIRDLLIRRKLLHEGYSGVDLDFLQLVPISDESKSMIEFQETSRRHAFNRIKAMRDNQWRRVRDDLIWHGEQPEGLLTSLENAGRKSRLQELDRAMYFEAYRHHQHPVYGRALLKKLKIGTKYDDLSEHTENKVTTRLWDNESPASALELVQSIQTRSDRTEPYVQKFACITPSVMANDFSKLFVTEAGSASIRDSQLINRPDPFHEARMKMSIAFPDKRLLQYDCGKLQRLDKLLRRLQSGGHRALIFTQMTKVLDILEQFLNIHGHLYLRLDGATKIEQRQILTERFNNDPRILCFILSSRSGGLGINLTGADTVIFYDLDWNPAMDKQCTDRAHRIGQTRDVHIYRFVSEHTIESNILRKANQKQILDDVVIQEGDFTTDYLNKVTYRDMLEENAEDDVAGAAMDRVLGNDRGSTSAFEQAEDREDIAAAKVAAREVQHADDGDFDDKVVATPNTNDAQTPGPFGATNAAMDEAENSDGHIDEYMLKFQKWLMRDVALGPLKDRSRKKKRKDEHRVRRPR